MIERRKHKRTSVDVEVELRCTRGSCQGLARDVSPRSLFIEVESGELPEANAIVQLNFKIWTGRHQLLRQASGRVVRTDDEGIAVSFAERDIFARGVIEEVIYYLDVAIPHEDDHSDAA